MNRLRIVLDTNVLISTALNPQGAPALVIHLVAFRAVELFASEAVLAEYREVFNRPKFARISPAEVATLLDAIEREATWVTPTERLAISKHDSDNRFYECAASAEADYIVTGNAKDFPKPVGKTKIITARELLELVASSPR